MDVMQTGTALAIVVISYLVEPIAKQIPKVDNSLIPVIVGISKVILGGLQVCI